MSGGLGALIRGRDSYFHISPNGPWAEVLHNDLDSVQYLSLINPFVTFKFGNSFGAMVPDSSLVSNGYALADQSRTNILYFLMGQNEKSDPVNGGPVVVKLSGVSGNYVGTWFDPRTGTETSIGVLNGGNDYSINPPNTDDWVLLQTRSSSPDTTPPNAPQNLLDVPVAN